MITYRDSICPQSVMLCDIIRDLRSSTRPAEVTSGFERLSERVCSTVFAYAFCQVVSFEMNAIIQILPLYFLGFVSHPVLSRAKIGVADLPEFMRSASKRLDRHCISHGRQGYRRHEHVF